MITDHPKASRPRRGPAPDARYERLNPGAKAQRLHLTHLAATVLTLYCVEVLEDEYRAGRFRNRSALPAFAELMAQTLRHGAYREGLAAMANRHAVHPRTLIRGSKALREPPTAKDRHGLLWHTRGTRESGVTVWRAAHPLVARIQAIRDRHCAATDAIVARKRARDELNRQLAIARDLNGHTVSDGKGDTVAQVAAPWAAGRAGEEASGRMSPPARSPDAERFTPEPDITGESGLGLCEHGRHRRACLACARAQITAF